MKVVVEFDLPEGQAIPDPREIVMLTSPDWIASWWHIDDVREHYAGDGEYIQLTDEECREVLRLAEKYHDCDVGICWDSLNVWQDQVFKQREKETA